MTIKEVQLPFSVICADPPWSFSDKLPGPTRGAAKNYSCLSTKELHTFPLPPIAENATLFLWRVASMQQEALDVIQAWGFRLKTEIVWVKITSEWSTMVWDGQDSSWRA